MRELNYTLPEIEDTLIGILGHNHRLAACVNKTEQECQGCAIGQKCDVTAKAEVALDALGLLQAALDCDLLEVLLDADHWAA